ncbi:MAG: hypothetical protein QOC63_751 [Mycobacterium sp.]|jgi:hypothetical protein|nr:hypothetical protein [Mycobacterium sp.]
MRLSWKLHRLLRSAGPLRVQRVALAMVFALFDWHSLKGEVEGVDYP